jgi:hypothetical protein
LVLIIPPYRLFVKGIAEVNEERRTRLRLLPVGRYSKALIVPAWWLKLNNNPEVLEAQVTLNMIALHPPPGGGSQHDKKAATSETEREQSEDEP